MSRSGQRSNAAPQNVWIEGADSADVIAVTPAVSTVPYTAGDNLGPVQVVTNANREGNTTVVLHSLVIFDKSNQKPTMTILFFDDAPVAKTNNDAFTWGTGDENKCIGRLTIASGDWETVAAKGIMELKNIGLEMKPSGRHLYAVAVVSSTPTLTSTSDLIFRYGLLQG